MELDMNESTWKTACPKAGCRNKKDCCCGLKYVSIPASLGDDGKNSPVAPKNGEYCSSIVIYEANKHVYIFSAEGIPTLIDVDATDISELETLTRDALERISEIEDGVLNVFDTVADMKVSTALMNGSYVRTLGFHSINDGGAALYKISNTGTANEMDVIAIGSTLYANLVYGDSLNVKQLGAYADDIHDDYAVFSRGVNLSNTLYIPDGTYIINSLIDISDCKNIKGQSKSSTIIKARNGFLYWSANNNYRAISDMTINGVQKDDNIGINGSLSMSCLSNINIVNFDKGIQTGASTWINDFRDICISYCNRGIYSSANFNNNTFYNCYFQHMTIECVRTPGVENKFIGCNFETSTLCFGATGPVMDIDGCYIEGNDKIFETVGSSGSSFVNVHNCWLVPGSNPSSGWLATFNTVSDPDSATAVLAIESCYIDNITQDTVRPFSFSSNSNKTYWAVTLNKNYYTNIKSSNRWVIYYDDLFDTTNCPGYATPSNGISFESDIPLYKYNHIVWYKESLGNIKGYARTNLRIKMLGYHEVESSSGAITITPDKKYGNMYPQITNLPVFIRFTDGSTDVGNMSIDSNNFYIWPNYNNRTTSRIIFDLSYYQGYES